MSWSVSHSVCCATVAFLTAILSTTNLEAAPSVAVVKTNNEWVVRNELSLPVVVLVASADNKVPKYTVLRVEPASEIAIPKSLGAVPELRATEPVSSRVSRAVGIKQCEPRAVSQIDIRELRQQLDYDAAATAEAKMAMRAAGELAAIETEQRIAAANVYVLNPLRQQYSKQELAYSATASTALVHDVLGPSYDDILRGVTAIAKRLTAWSTAQKEKIEILYRETKTLGPVLKNAELAVRIERDQLARDRALAQAGRQFSERLAQELLSADARPEVPALGGVQLRRSCADESGVEDWFEFNRQESLPVVMVAAATFDKGGSYPVVVRRIVNTNTWIGRVFWPIDATSVQLSLRSDTAPVVLGEPLQVGRPSLTQNLATIVTARDLIKQKYKENRFRVAGADSIKTIPIQ